MSKELKLCRIDITSIHDRVPGELMAQLDYRHEPTHDDTGEDVFVVASTRLNASEPLIRLLISETEPQAYERLARVANQSNEDQD